MVVLLLVPPMHHQQLASPQSVPSTRTVGMASPPTRPQTRGPVQETPRTRGPLNLRPPLSLEDGSRARARKVKMPRLNSSSNSHIHRPLERLDPNLAGTPHKPKPKRRLMPKYRHKQNGAHLPRLLPATIDPKDPANHNRPRHRRSPNQTRRARTRTRPRNLVFVHAMDHGLKAVTQHEPLHPLKPCH